MLQWQQLLRVGCRLLSVADELGRRFSAKLDLGLVWDTCCGTVSVTPATVGGGMMPLFIFTAAVLALGRGGLFLFHSKVKIIKIFVGVS